MKIYIFTLWYVMLSFFFVFTKTKSLEAQSKFGKCSIGSSNVKSMPGFDINSMIGKFYGIYTTAKRDVLLCSYSTYEPINAKTLKQTTTGISPNGKVLQFSGILRQPNVNDSAGVSMLFHQDNSSNVYPVTVLDASWDSWAALYICLTSGNTTSENHYLIVSRNQSMTEEDTKKAMNAFTKIGVDVSSFIKKKQEKDCN